MYIQELSEPQLLVIYPGRFQPFHKGHHAVFESLVGKYGRNNVYIVTSNKVEEPKSPFTFSEKSYFMQLTGVPADRIVQSANPYQIESIMAGGQVNVTSPEHTVVIFAVSQKDMEEDPRFKSWTKKDGTPAYFQPMPANIRDTKSMKEHGYIMTVPTFDFTVLGEPMRSGTELRAMYSDSDEKTRQQIVKDLFGKYTIEAEQIMSNKLAPRAPVQAPRPTKLAKTVPAAGLAEDLPPPENARKTQIAGTLGTYKKARGMLDKEAPQGKSLDFGAGLGHGTKELAPDADSYEPFPGGNFKPHFVDVTKIPDNTYHRIVNLNVLNVVPNVGEHKIRDSIVQNIGRVLAPGGVAIITTRGRDVLTIKGSPGEEPMSMVSKIGTYQKGFTPAELLSYIQATLGDGFIVRKIKLGPAGVMIQKKDAISEMGGVGVVKGGNDPRYMTATMGDQNDVDGETLGKMMRGYGLVGKLAPKTGQYPVSKNVGKGK